MWFDDGEFWLWSVPFPSAIVLAWRTNLRYTLTSCSVSSENLNLISKFNSYQRSLVLKPDTITSELPCIVLLVFVTGCISGIISVYFKLQELSTNTPSLDGSGLGRRQHYEQVSLNTTHHVKQRTTIGGWVHIRTVRPT